jgi:hypothetical protein
MSWPPSQPVPRRRPWVRAGCLSAAISVPIGLGLLVLAQLEWARWALPVAFVVAIVTFWVVGRREGLMGRGAWAKAGCLLAGLAYLGFGAALFMWAMSGCPGITPGC